MSVYRLRGDVQVERAPGGGTQVTDPTLHRVIRLGEIDARVVRALGQGGTWAALARQTGLQQEELARRLTGLARLYLLQGRRTQARIKLQVEREAFARQCQHPASDEAIEWPSGRDPPRHGCVGTGTCCSATFLGPLLPADHRRVASLRFGSRVRKHAGHPDHTVRLGPGGDVPSSELFESIDISGATHIGMARGSDGRCVAQGDDGLCDVHREHGSAAKPVACRLFPLRLHRSPKGIHVSLLLACDGYDRARQAAEPWPERQGEIRSLLAEGATPVRAALPFEWSPGLAVPQSSWWALRDELLQAEPQLPDGRAWLLAILPLVSRALAERERALREGPDILPVPALGALTAALHDPASLYDGAELAAYVADLQARAAKLRQDGELRDSERLADLALGLQAQGAGRQIHPSLPAEPLAQRHLHDIVANDLPMHVALGHLDAGIGLLVRRLLLAEALACALAERAASPTVTAAHTTRALHVCYRSEPDLLALARIATLG